MFNCKKHGALRRDWCADCGEIIKCDCTDRVTTRFKDLIYDTEVGEKCVTLYLHHCETCGKTSHVDIK